MNFLIVNYHYIHENKYPHKGIYPTSVEKFEEQIKKLGKTYKFVSQQDILERKLPEKSCLITFDDGLSSQYENALPILDKYKIPAIFFVNGLPYDGRACLVHKKHWCRANIPPKEFLNKIIENIHLGGEMIIEKMFWELVKDEKKWCEEFYISKEGLKDLAGRGYLGIHSYSHNPLINADFEMLKVDFQENLKVIKKITGHSPRAISYPYGYKEILKAAKAAKSVGLEIGFTVEKAFNRTLQSPLLLARIDTNDVPVGKFPLNIKEKRTLYFKE